jgi:hypothetical protein
MGAAAQYKTPVEEKKRARFAPSLFPSLSLSIHNACNQERSPRLPSHRPQGEWAGGRRSEERSRLTLKPFNSARSRRFVCLAAPRHPHSRVPDLSLTSLKSTEAYWADSTSFCCSPSSGVTCHLTLRFPAEISAEQLLQETKAVRVNNWKTLSHSGVDLVPRSEFSLPRSPRLQAGVASPITPNVR